VTPGDEVLPAASAPFLEVRPLRAQRGVAAVAGIDPGRVGQPVEDLLHHVGVQRVEPGRVLLRVPDAAGEPAATGAVAGCRWLVFASLSSVASSLTSGNGPGSAQVAVLPGNSGLCSGTCLRVLSGSGRAPHPAGPCVLGADLPAAAYNGFMAAADVEKFRVVFDLCDAGVRMYRQRLRRENPLASDEEVEAWVQAWLRRPSGEAGDRLRFLAPVGRLRGGC